MTGSERRSARGSWLAVAAWCGGARLAPTLLCALLALPPVVAAGKAAAPVAPAASAASAPPGKTTLSAIVEASAEQDAFEAGIRHHLPGQARIEAMTAEARDEAKAFGTLDAPMDTAETELAQRLVVFDRISRLRNLDGRIEATARELSQWADRLDTDLDRIAKREAEAAAWLATAQERQAPEVLVLRLQALPARHAALVEQVRASRDQAVLLLEQVAALRSRLSAELSRLEARGAALEERLRAAHAAPLWQVAPASSRDTGGSAAFVAAELAGVRAYLLREAGLLVGVALTTIALAIFAMRSARRQLADEGSDPTTLRTQALFDRPWTASLALALFAVTLFSRSAPLLFYNLMWALMSLPAALLVRRVLETDARLALYVTVAVIASISALDPLVGPLPMAGRWLHIIQYLAVALALGLDLRGGRLLIGRMLRPTLSRRLTQAVMALLVLAALCSAAGSVGLARSLGHGALGAIGFWLVLIVLAHLLYGLGVGLLDSPLAQRIRTVALHGGEIRRLLRRALAGLVIVCWLLGMMQLLGLSSGLYASLQAFLDADLAIGDVTLSTENIVAGLLVLAGTWLLVKVVRLLLEVEILPRVIRRRGVAFALSAIVRYGLITAGVLLALAAMGIDLTKVTVIAGALGVGIGFGLQSVVNNFLSGLILLVERPVTAGDVVQIGDVQGVVSSIGVRSTTVRTPAGAEVIVPNADLITKVVSNWTLSDNRCRIEIEVNVPSAVDPDTAIGLLENAAAEIGEVAERPAPKAWLSGLRDGQRSYKLHAWIADYDTQTAVQSALRVHIARRFAQEGVALP